jgi:integrating conjugative element protein (TIGR03759 family)
VKTLITATLLLVTAGVVAEPILSTVKEDKLQPDNVEQVATIADSSRLASEQLAYEQYGLNEQEWLRYKAIMVGPIGNTNPQINPLLALAMAGRNEAETLEYMRKFADLKKQLTERALYLSRLYPRVFFENYDQPVIDKTRFANAETTIQDTDTFVLVTMSQCSKCADKVQTAITRTRVFPRNPLDIYVQDLKEDTDLLAWANQHIGLGDSASGRLSVNGGTQYLASIVTDDNPVVLLVRRDDRLIPVSGLDGLLR